MIDSANPHTGQMDQVPAELALWRSAGPEDERMLFALFAEDKRAEFLAGGLAESLVRSLIQMQYRGRAMTYAARYPASGNSILIADDGTPVGRLLLDRGMACTPECWRIVDIAVLAAHRGKGLGTQILKECQRLSEAAGAGLELQVAPGNPARRLYERLGFHAVREDATSVEMVWSPAR
jgi:ribosomal protein S18 acetylase RimI-like enzyme